MEGLTDVLAVNYRLKTDDIAYIFDHAGAEVIIVDAEFAPLLDGYKKSHPGVPLIIDDDTDATEGELSGAIRRGGTRRPTI